MAKVKTVLSTPMIVTVGMITDKLRQQSTFLK